MLNILDKYESLLRVLRNSDEFDEDLFSDLLNFLYQRELSKEEESEPQSLIELWQRDSETEE